MRTFEAPNGERVTITDDLIVDAFLNAGFTEVTEEEKKKK